MRRALAIRRARRDGIDVPDFAALETTTHGYDRLWWSVRVDYDKNVGETHCVVVPRGSLRRETRSGHSKVTFAWDFRTVLTPYEVVE